MNLEKLKDMESEFLTFYPKGFEDAKFFPTMKKFNPSKLEEFTKENLKKENFSNPNLVVDAFFKIIQKSVLVSLFDKLKFRDMLAVLTTYEKDMLSIELYELLHGNKRNGFDGLVEFLAQYSLAKWTIISVVLYYNHRQKEYFIKPTTTKNVIKYFEIKDLIYKPTPSFEFYDSYKKILNEMKKNVDKSLSFDNAAFTGFLRIGMED
jgi:hypothetical protein